MEQELERLDAVHRLLDTDGATLGRAAAEQEGYGGDADEARRRVQAYKGKQAADRRAMLMAFGVLAASAVYLMLRRWAWALAGVRLPP
jgi:hypothetical protein